MSTVTPAATVEPGHGGSDGPSAGSARPFVTRWRIAFILYVVALTTATHWPRLQLPGGVPDGDKLVHFLVFGTGTLLLWQTRWLRWRWAAVAIGLAWCTADELSQELSFVHRDFTGLDMVANVLGVLVAGAWLWAMRPMGRSSNRMRLRRQRYIVDQLLHAPRTWLVLGAVLLACGLPTAVAWRSLSQMGADRLLLIATAVWLMTTAAFLLRLWQQERDAVGTNRPCFACGASCAGDRPQRSCSACGETIHLGQWARPPAPTAAGQFRLMVWPLAVSIFSLAVVYVLIHLSSELYEFFVAQQKSTTAPRVARFIGQLPQSLVRTIDLGVVLLVFASAVGAYRSSLARFYDRAVGCPRCGHDLRGTPAPGGHGRCGECGAAFSRNGSADG